MFIIIQGWFIIIIMIVIHMFEVYHVFRQSQLLWIGDGSSFPWNYKHPLTSYDLGYRLVAFRKGKGFP
jgi:hypothetical protein